MNPTDIEGLGAQYGAEYYERYGRGPYSYQTAAPYRHGEPLWERYFGHIADLIASELAPVTVLDAGCAIGFLVDALRSRRIEAWGIDISEFAIEHVPDAVREFCSVASVTDDLERDYDLIVCIEVLEHLPAELAARAVVNLCSHSEQVLFSASPQGFRDPTHLNVRPTDYWVELFGRYGFFRNVDVDASVIAPHAIHLVRANRTAVSIAAEYERWHWRTLSEVRDLRAARETGADAALRAERAEEQMAELRRRLDESQQALRAAERDERDAARDAQALQSRLKDRQREVAELRRRLDERDAAVRQAGLERTAIERQLADLAGRDVLARQLEDEIAALHSTRLFRYAAGPRRLYGRLRTRGAQAPAPAPPDLLPATEASALERPHVPPVHHCIDVPAEGHAVESDLLLPVRGWAVGERSVVSRVVVVVNGVDCGPARLGLFRPDVANALAKASALVSGFETLVDLRDVPDWENGVRIELQVETLAGGSHTIDEDDVIELAPPDEEEPELELLDEDTTFEPPDMKRFAESSAQAAIRLLVFTHDLGLGGGQLYLFELLRLLAGRDDFAATVVAPNGGPLRKELEELGFPVAIEGAYPVGAIAEYEGRRAQLVSWAREGGFNAVLANTFGSFPGVDVAARLGVPALWAIHESFDLDGFWRAAYGSPDAVHPLVKERAASALASAAAVVFEADATRNLYAHHGDTNRFVTIPYGIDVAEIDRFLESKSRSAARAELGIMPDATVLLCLGTIEPRKAQVPLAQAFEAVAAEHPDAILAFVGARHDPFSVALEQFVDWAALARHVRIERVTDQIYPWYRAADALLCASDVESLPRTVLEAMAFAVPVIATRVFGLPELIDDGVTGYLCEPRDTAALARALDRFLSSGSEQRAAIGAAGAAVVRDRHDSRGYAEAYDRLLRSLIEDPTRTPAQILR